MFLSVCVFPGNRTHNLLRCWRNALPLSHTGTRFPRCPWPWAESRDPGNNWLELLCVCVCVCVCVYVCVSVFVCPHLTRRLCFSMPSCLGLSANLIWHWRPTAHRSGVLCVCVCLCVCVFDSTNLCGCVWNYFGVWMPESRQLLVLTGGHKHRWLCETENAAHVARLANRNSRLILETWDKMKYTSNVISDIFFNHKINFTIESWHDVFAQF